MSEKPKLSLELNLRSRALGICLNGKDLYAVGVRNQINQLQFKGWECLPDFEGRTDEDVQDFIEDAQSNMGIKRADAFMVLPRSQVMIQMAEFPPEAANNLEEAMEYQLVNYFAIELEDYNFFPQIVSRDDVMKVMIVAIKKEYLGHAFGLIRRWGLRLAGLTLDTFAMANGYARLAPNRYAKDKTVFFRSFPNGLEMSAVREGKLVLSHYIPLEKVRPEGDEDSEGDIPTGDLVNGIELGFSMGRIEPNEVDHYHWAGKDLPEVREYLAEEAGIPFEELVDGMGAPLPPEGLVGFGTAVCAVHDNVMHDLNMLPEKQRKHQKRLPVILGTGIVALAVLFFVIGEAKDYMALRTQDADLQARFEKIQGRMNEVGTARQAYENKQTELELYKRFQTNRMLMRVIHAMAQDLPDDTYLTSLIIKKGNEISIQGESDDPFNVQRILTRMPFLTDVQPSNAITSGRRKDGKRRFIYKATLVLEELR